jgi:uncharacterized protein (TIGR02246 family)
MKTTTLLCALALAACDSSQREAGLAAPEDAARVRATIERRNADLARWIAAGQQDSVASVFAEDAVQMPPDAPRMVGREAIRQTWVQLMSAGTWRFEFDTEEVVVSGPVSVERGAYTLDFAPGQSAPPALGPMRTRGGYLAYWRRETDGEWRIVWYATVSEGAPARTGNTP